MIRGNRAWLGKAEVVETWPCSELWVRSADLIVPVPDDRIIISIRTCENWNVREETDMSSLRTMRAFHNEVSR